MSEDEQFQIGELSAMLSMIDRKVDKLQEDVDAMKEQRAHLLGVGAAVSFCIASCHGRVIPISSISFRRRPAS